MYLIKRKLKDQRLPPTKYTLRAFATGTGNFNQRSYTRTHLLKQANTPKAHSNDGTRVSAQRGRDLW